MALAGIVAFFLLPVSPMPDVDIPAIVVQAHMAGASPETMATSVATPLERHLGAIADVDEMTSSSSVGSTRVILQFGLDRDIDGAARDVQAAINAARADLPASLRSNPTYRKINPADAPIMILALTSDTLSPGRSTIPRRPILQQKLSQVSGIGQVQIGGSFAAGRARRSQSAGAVQIRHRARRHARRPVCAPTPTRPRARSTRATLAFRSTPTTRPRRPTNTAR